MVKRFIPLLACLATAATATAGAIPAKQPQLYFEPNAGQTAGPVKFVARTAAGALFVTEDAIVLRSQAPNQPTATPQTPRT